MDLTSYLLGKKAGGGGGPTPTGTINITENGEHDVTNYASADVNVSGATISAGTGNNDPGINKVIENGTFTIQGQSCEYMFTKYPFKKIPTLLGTSNVTDMSYMFYNCTEPTNYNLSNYDTSNVTTMEKMFYTTSYVYVRNLDCSSFTLEKLKNTNSMFYGLYQLAILDISGFDFGNNNLTNFTSMFSICGSYSKQVDGAYADGIPYVYVKDQASQNWVLTANNGHPNTWTTDNVIVKQ